MEDNYFKWAVIAGLLAAALIGGVIYFNGASKPPAVATAATVPTSTQPASATTTHYDVPDDAVDTGAEPTIPAVKPAALPTLDDSDAAFAGQLRALLGGALDSYLVPTRLIRHLVVTLDNLPRDSLPPLADQPTKPVDGSLQITRDGNDHFYLAPANDARYQPLLALFESVDPHRFVALYFHYYPLFQQAYVDIGYPQGYFNDRLVQVIDNLLATPEPQGPIELVRPKVYYQFADPSLESLSTGQKMLLRIGASNRAELKARLRTIRALVAAHPRTATK